MVPLRAVAWGLFWGVGDTDGDMPFALVPPAKVIRLGRGQSASMFGAVVRSAKRRGLQTREVGHSDHFRNLEGRPDQGRDGNSTSRDQPSGNGVRVTSAPGLRCSWATGAIENARATRAG